MLPTSPRFRFRFSVVVLVAAILVAPGFNRIAMSEPAAPQPANTRAQPKVEKPTQAPTAIPSDEELRKRLTPLQYAVTRENATERPFTNEYWKHNGEGIYVDIISGKPLFSSKDKFDTDCGWPGFAKPIDAGEVNQLADKTHGMERIEVRTNTGDAH